MVANTPAWGLPYPDDYQQPADSPNALEDLAVATDAAITNLQAQGRGEFMHGRDATQTTDWNNANESGAYWSDSDAANQPAASVGADFWVGLTTAHTDWAHQIAWPLALTATPYPPNVMVQRARRGGSWGAWQRVANYGYSWGTIDGLRFMQHASGGAGSEITRFADGLKKDDTTAGPSPADEWRVQCYDAAGNFTWSAIRIPESGIVTMPKGHALAMERLSDGQPLDPEQVVTVGVLLQLLARAGIEVRP